jgi:hypothetical protein
MELGTPPFWQTQAPSLFSEGTIEFIPESNLLPARIGLNQVMPARKKS